MADLLHRPRNDRVGPAGGFVRLLAHTGPVALVGILRRRRPSRRWRRGDACRRR
ncbi:hypothetical protein [Micromonospora sp. NPDC005161]